MQFVVVPFVFEYDGVGAAVVVDLIWCRACCCGWKQFANRLSVAVASGAGLSSLLIVMAPPV
jgi:hypothetical protein